MKRGSRDHKDSGTPATTNCTACHAVIHLKRSTPFRHPILNVLICKKCRDFYGNGEWTRDENGQDEYCRWCAEGGQLYICCNDDCLSGFCKKCIKRNFDASECQEVEDDDDWRCYICNPEKLKAVQENADQVLNKLEKLREKDSRAVVSFNNASKENGTHSPAPQSSFKALLEALEGALNSGKSGGDKGKAKRIWNDIETRLVSLGDAMKSGDFSEAAKLVGSLIDSESPALPAPLPAESPRPPSPAFSGPPTSPRSARSASPPPKDSPPPASTSALSAPSSPAASPSPPASSSPPQADSPAPGSPASSASTPARAPPKSRGFMTSTPAHPSRKSPPRSASPPSRQSPGPEVAEDRASTPESLTDPRDRVKKSVEEALQKLVEVSRGNTKVVRPESPDGGSPFLDSDEDSEKSRNAAKTSRAKKTKKVRGVEEVVRIKSEPADEDQMDTNQGTQKAGETATENDPVDNKKVKPGSSKNSPEETELSSSTDENKIIWKNLTIRDFVANGLEVRIERLETLLDREEALKAAATRKRNSDEEEFDEEDLELLKLLRDPLERRRLRKNIQHATDKQKADLRKTSEEVSAKRKTLESESDEDDSEGDRISAKSSYDSSEAPPSNALVLRISENEQEEAMPSQLSSDSEDEIQIIAEVKASRRKKPKKEVISDSEDNEKAAQNGVVDEESGDERPPMKKRAIPANVSDEPSTSKRKRAQKNCDSDESSSKRRKTKRRKVRIIDSDEEEAQEDEKLEELSPLVSDSGSELEEPEKPKRKRKSKKKKATIGDSGSDNEENESEEKKKERSIRKIISDDKVEKESRAAAKEEAERRKRVLERQKLYNEIEAALQKERKTDKVTRCVLEYDPTTKEPIVEVDEALVRSMKPHQVEGVKFLYNTVIESIEQVSKGKPGGGAILAHCMGLGKTFQTICLLHTLLTHKVLNQHIKKVIVVCPCNVVLNWAREFEMWVEENVDVKGNIAVYEFSRVKNIYDRMDLLEDWSKNGGVLIIGYSMFRLMSQNKTKSRKVKDRLPKLLHDPGADIVICDEGHTLKSDKAQISKAMNLIKTQRRLILTGTPLQNNMSEYHCMVSFVKPNLLGTPKEFNNRFMNPITYGQEANASSYAVRLMKKRVHILNKLLAGCVHRCDYSHLTPYLPAKFEYIISIELTELQKKLYREYLKHIGITEETTREDLRCRSLLKDYQTLKMIWSHPFLLMESEDRQEDRRQKEAYKNQLDEFVVEGSEEDSASSGSGSETNGNDGDSGDEEVVKTYKTRRNRRENPGSESEPEEENSKKKYDKTWWISHVPEEEDEFVRLGLSSKLTMAFEILRECELIGDKVILFSTSLLTLSLFEKNLHIEYEKASQEKSEGDYINSWVHGLDYFRLDGSTSVEARKRYIDQFNDMSNLRARLFLVSTRAGGIGTNMIGANRIIVLDASWNPSDDTQAIFRAFRYGQVKPVYVYRLLAHATMEEKIYDRQVNKISLASRVVDEQNLERHFNESDLKALYEFKPEKDARKTPSVPKDRLLAELLISKKTLIQGYHEHDSLLQKELEDELTEEERKQAWKEYEDERDGKAPPQMPYQMPGPYNNIPGFAGNMPGFAGGGIGGMPGIPGMPNFTGGIHRMPGYGIPGTSGFNQMPNQWNAQMAQQFMAQLAARARLPNNVSYAAYQNQFMPRTAQRPAGNVNFQQRPAHAHSTNSTYLPRPGNIPRHQGPTAEEILSRPPHFDAVLNHPSLNPKKMLEDIKLKYPTEHQVTIAGRWKTALKTARDKYAATLSRLKQTIELYEKQGRTPPPDALTARDEYESGVKICDHLVVGIESSYERFKHDIALEQRKGASSSRPTVIDLDSPTPGKEKSGRSGPIIEEIE